MTGRLSVSVVPKSPVQQLTEVLEVLHEERAVVAGLVDALRELVRREPAAERRGDRVAGRAASGRRPTVTRMKIVGKISRNRISR